MNVGIRGSRSRGVSRARDRNRPRSSNRATSGDSPGSHGRNGARAPAAPSARRYFNRNDVLFICHLLSLQESYSH